MIFLRQKKKMNHNYVNKKINSNYRFNYQSVGSFGIQRVDIMEWGFCRDWFHRHSHGIKLFFYSHDWNRGKNIAKFIFDIEKRLNIKNKTEFGPTEVPRATWVKISTFWSRKSMRRSLFTILLRIGSNYNGKNFDDVMNSHYYVQDTKYALNRFLSGYTRYTGKTRGWYKQFGRFDSEGIVDPNTSLLYKKMVRELLVKC